MHPAALNKKRAMAIASLVATAQALAVHAGVSEQDITNMLRPYGRGVDREVNQLHHLAHVLDASAVAIIPGYKAPAVVEDEAAADTGTETGDLLDGSDADAENPPVDEQPAEQPIPVAEPAVAQPRPKSRR